MERATSYTNLPVTFHDITDESLFTTHQLVASIESEIQHKSTKTNTLRLFIYLTSLEHRDNSKS